VSIGRREVKFILLKFAFWCQVCDFVLVPEKSGQLIKASLYLVFPANWSLSYQAVGAASNHGKALKEEIAGNCKILKTSKRQQNMEFGFDILISLDVAPTAWYKRDQFVGNN